MTGEIVTRRNVVGMLGSAAAASALPGSVAYAQSKGELTVALPGGVVKEIETELYAKTLTAEKGYNIKVVVADSGVLEQLRAQVTSKRVIWDVTEINSQTYPAMDLDLLEKIDYSIVDPKNILPAYAKRPNAVLVLVWATALTQRIDKLPAGKEMTSWADFWDVKTFPGPRAMRRQANHNLEFALIADGAPKDKVYELLATDEGVNRAFAKMDKIKPHINAWWESGAQAVQLMSDGEVYYSPMFNGRLQKLTDSGIPTKIAWAGGAFHITYHGILKGSKNVKEAHEWLRIRATNPELAAKYVETVPYPAAIPGAFDKLPAKLQALLPTTPPNPEIMYIADEGFWYSARGDKIRERFLEWVIS
ncbi:putative spermidine/putrescine transport system substrate-binding protein [Bosea sp. OK403]|uniref:extracellular solute-binding protein n=1 Tax=Bosea sp. OK403 TaxID=1855286 RepID=UPI0008EE9532|nr:extracellular solute-binding protein [Bosea sp. OK403]SFJ73388.1 putative spermidine/putrescine transport system substrate-binding protein [Bosea sp. OK403]